MVWVEFGKPTCLRSLHVSASYPVVADYASAELGTDLCRCVKPCPRLAVLANWIQCCSWHAWKGMVECIAEGWMRILGWLVIEGLKIVSMRVLLLVQGWDAAEAAVVFAAGSAPVHLRLCQKPLGC